MNRSQTKDSERWIMSFYRTSEISGALFFGRLAGFLPAGPLQRDITKHFSDESMHAWYWTQVLGELGHQPIRIARAYQDDYLEAAGLPTNVMEILVLTNVFERRVMRQYTQHLKLANLHPAIARTIRAIIEDERWHIKWINQALRKLEGRFGKAQIEQAGEHYRKADQEVYGRFVAENEERLRHIIDIEHQRHI